LITFHVRCGSVFEKTLLDEARAKLRQSKPERLTQLVSASSVAVASDPSVQAVCNWIQNASKHATKSHDDVARLLAGSLGVSFRKATIAAVCKIAVTFSRDVQQVDPQQVDLDNADRLPST